MNEVFHHLGISLKRRGKGREGGREGRREEGGREGERKEEGREERSKNNHPITIHGYTCAQSL